MNYQLQKITINNEQISYYLKDNNVKWTVLFIHGYMSSSDFASEIFKLNQNFNIIALNLPGSHYLDLPKQTLSIDYFNQIVDYFINHHLKTRYLILLGHSLGGGTAASLSQNKKVKRVIYLSSINPRMVESQSWKKLYDFYYPKKIDQQANETYIATKPELEEIFDKTTLYVNLTKKYLLNKEYVTKTLFSEYKNSLNKQPLFIIGDSDYVIETKAFVNFVTKDLQQQVLIIPNVNHSPLKEKPYFLNELLNQEIRYKKRFWPIKLIK